MFIGCLTLKRQKVPFSVQDSEWLFCLQPTPLPERINQNIHRRAGGFGDLPGYWGHVLSDQSLDIVTGWWGLWWGWGRVSWSSWYPSSSLSHSGALLLLSYVFSLSRLSSYNWSDSASVSLSRTNTSEMKNGGNKNWFPWLQDLEVVLSHHH